MLERGAGEGELEGEGDEGVGKGEEKLNCESCCKAPDKPLREVEGGDVSEISYARCVIELEA